MNKNVSDSQCPVSLYMAVLSKNLAEFGSVAVVAL